MLLHEEGEVVAASLPHHVVQHGDTETSAAHAHRTLLQSVAHARLGDGVAVVGVDGGVRETRAVGQDGVERISRDVHSFWVLLKCFGQQADIWEADGPPVVASRGGEGPNSLHVPGATVCGNPADLHHNCVVREDPAVPQPSVQSLSFDVVAAVLRNHVITTERVVVVSGLVVDDGAQRTVLVERLGVGFEVALFHELRISPIIQGQKIFAHEAIGVVVFCPEHVELLGFEVLLINGELQTIDSLSLSS
mmetsp:Transcript_29171/g.62858  ORF Transcript_29171/g.62858 Transcript_29171/m.62858 type:complete len:249 (-) Transcript_29171:252-998(-)